MTGLMTRATWLCLQASKNQCWSVPQETFTAAVPEELKFFLRENYKKLCASNPAAYTPGTNLRSPRLTVQNKLRRTRRAPYKLARTTKWCLYKSPITPFPYCCSPSLLGDSTKAATVDVSQARKTTSHPTLKTKVPLTPLQQPGAPGRAQQRRPLNSCSLLPSRSQRRPMPPVFATLQPRPVLDVASACPTIPVEQRLDVRPSARWSDRSTRHLCLWRPSSSKASSALLLPSGSRTLTSLLNSTSLYYKFSRSAPSTPL